MKVEPKPQEIPTVEVPKVLSELTNTRGVKELVEALVALRFIGELVYGVMDNDGLDAGDIQDVIKLISNLDIIKAGYQGIADVPAELADEITDAELDEINAVFEKANIPGLPKQDIKDVIFALRTLKRIIL